MDAEVLIVGGGPTGLMLANQLGRRGVRAMIIDRHSGPAQQTRAMAVHARTLEIYSKLGIAERALELGRRGNGANMWAEGKWAARIPLGEIGKSVSPFPFVLMLGKDRWRVIGILPKKLRGRDDVTFDELSPDIRREAGANLAFKQCSWFSTYRIHHRAAEKFRDRRCFLLGDAAHVHSPMGGQGMNTGLQDAYNLAWKLALVVNGRADSALLDSYAAERIPVARRLLVTTDRAFVLVVSDSWLAGLFRTRILARIAAFVMTFERPKQLAFRTLSQTGIAYRESPLSKSFPGLPGCAPRAGDRFPWLQLKFRAKGPVDDLFPN